MVYPSPWQVGQGTTNWKKPCEFRTWPEPPALAAGFAGRPRRGARAVAFPAGDHPGDVQGDFRTPRRLREGDVQIVAQIRARRGARPAAACTAAHAESKHIPKDIAEMSEDIFGGPKASEVAVVSDTSVTN